MEESPSKTFNNAQNPAQIRLSPEQV